jgi:hypothetical protein
MNNIKVKQYNFSFPLCILNAQEVAVNLRLTVSWPVCLGVRCFLSDNCGFRAVRCPLWWEDRFVIYCTIASGPYQSSHTWVEVPQNSRPYFTVSSETPPTWRDRSRIYIPQEQGGPVIPSGTGFPFCRLLRLAGLWWRYSNPPPHGSVQKL